MIIDTDTRSRNVLEVEQIYARLIRQLKTMHFDLIYKKTDSILRGHVIEELEILTRELGFTASLLIPANPSVHRFIKNGRYYIDEVPLDQTHFSRDPEYPRHTSDISSLLEKKGSQKITLLKVGEKIQKQGIQIGECQSLDDLESWASQLKASILPAGASDFFEEILKSKHYVSGRASTKENFRHRYPMLIVVGSVSGQSVQNLRRFSEIGMPLCSPPAKVNMIQMSKQALVLHWAEQIITSFRKFPVVVVSASHLNRSDNINLKDSMTSILSSVTGLVFHHIDVKEILIEGGATASALVRHLEWDCLVPVYEFQKGVTALTVFNYPGCRLIVKPGSYSWPDYFFSGFNFRSRD
jgi:uncharacterized protein YgbK (DUF1537 family)